MFNPFRRRKRPSQAPQHVPLRNGASAYEQCRLKGPLLVDFSPRTVRYVGDACGAWFVSHLHEPGLFALDNTGNIHDLFPCPPVDRVLVLDEHLVGLDWQHAWGRRSGYSSVGDREHATGYDATTGQKRLPYPR